MVNQVVQAGAAQGAMNMDVTKFMIDSVNTVAGQTQAIDQMRTVMKQLTAINKGQQAAQQQSANAFKSQMMVLFQ